MQIWNTHVIKLKACGVNDNILKQALGNLTNAFAGAHTCYLQLLNYLEYDNSSQCQFNDRDIQAYQAFSPCYSLAVTITILDGIIWHVGIYNGLLYHTRISNKSPYYFNYNIIT